MSSWIQTMDKSKKIWSKIDVMGLIQLFIKTTTVAMVITDTKGIILWCNDPLGKLYEEPVKDILGTHFGDRVIYPKGVNIVDRMQRAIEQGCSEPLRTKGITKSGQEKFVHQQIYRLDDTDGNHIGFWGAGYELTQEKKAVDDSMTAVRVLTELQKGEIQEKQLDVIEMIKMQSDVLCPAKSLRDNYCPAILAVEESIIKDRPRLKTLLTNTEHKVATYTKRRMTIKNISKKMSISERTVKNHRHSIRKKLNISNTKVNLTKYLQSVPI